MMKLGNELLLLEHLDLIKGKHIGLITNHSGVTSQLERTADLLHHHSDVNLVILFGPEHGLSADAPDGMPVASNTDTVTGLPVYSLYGETLKPTQSALESLDLLLYDIQDLGVRYYTFMYTMTYAMEACAEIGLPFIVLDRPTPLNGLRVEGNILDPSYSSFVGKYPIPIRYGMTVGEFARFANSEFSIGADLTVVPMEGWKRGSFFDQTGLLWVPPSPNMPTLDAALLYPGTCLIEGTEISEGRGTCKPFEQIGAPYIDSHKLSAHLNRLGLPGLIFRPTSFIPSTDKFAGERCSGVQIHITDRSHLQTVRTGLELISTIRHLYPDQFEWRARHFDHLAGTNTIREAIESREPIEGLIVQWEEDVKDFIKRREVFLIYR
jgi:beta-N-acetylhexosaminidase